MLEPLTLERMDAASGPILVALSGGGDSVALLHLLTEHFGAGRLRAAIVDHRLREGSERDAARAAELATMSGVQARVLQLTWADGANRAHEAARRARYEALCAAARAFGSRVIATGHTRDDQAETVLLRASRGSGLRGLAGMRAFGPAPIWPEGRGLWLARPLLGARRAALRAYLSARKASWVEDPANENIIHARVRARRALAKLEHDGLDPMRLAALAERLQPSIQAIDRHATALIAQAVSFDEDEISLHRSSWRAEQETRARALYALIVAASGAERGPSPMQIENLAAEMDRAKFSGATLGGALLQTRGERLIIRRDPGALAGRADGAAPMAPFPLTAGEEGVWDGRLALAAWEPGWSVVCDGAAPELQRGAERRPLAAASPHWLLKERARHVLGAN